MGFAMSSFALLLFILANTKGWRSLHMFYSGVLTTTVAFWYIASQLYKFTISKIEVITRLHMVMHSTNMGSIIEPELPIFRHYKGERLSSKDWH